MEEVEVHLGLLDLLKLGAKFASHQFLQYRLATSESVVVPTSCGQVKGLKRRTVYDDVYYAFEGIPYAKPPLGELRFRAPQPAEPWPGVRDCTRIASMPLQEHFVMHIKVGSEDCLYLNVYAKTLQSAKPLPVMVWIYGGGFQIGEATRDIYAPDYFMKKDVVLVTVSYRLGALGFLSLSDPDLQVPGNAGLKDQLLALRWVQANITNFKGDPHNVTLFGNSAGAASTHLLMLADKSKGLFHKAILQSGTALCSWAHVPPRDWPYRLALKLGYGGSNNDKEVFRFLTQLDGRQIAGTDLRLHTEDEYSERLLFLFVPVVEPYDSEDALLRKPFTELLATTWSNQIPLILGGTSLEGLFCYSHTLRAKHLRDEVEDCTALLPPEVKAQRGAGEIKEMGLRLKATYFSAGQPASLKETFMAYLDWASHKYFWHGIHRVVLARSAYAPTAATYLYRFDLDSPHFNQYRLLRCGKSVRGVSHSDDLSYLFYSAMGEKLAPDTVEYKTIERMIGMWTAFAATANPNCAAIAPTTWQPLEWTSSDQLPMKCLNIGEKVEVTDLPESAKLKVWDSLYTKETLY